MYTTVEDYQTSIDIVIYEGERSHIEGNTQLGEFVIEGIERAKREHAKVEVIFEIDANGILKVSARDKVTMVENSVVIANAKGRLSSVRKNAPRFPFPFHRFRIGSDVACCSLVVVCCEG